VKSRSLTCGFHLVLSGNWLARARPAAQLKLLVAEMETSMDERVPRADYPWWVKLSMWGVPGRVGLWAFVAISIACAAGCVVYGFWDVRFFTEVLFLFSALMYWLTIRWIDCHGSWGSDADPDNVHARGGRNLLTPDAERNARARFKPNSDTIVDDPSIRPDKRNIKPADR